MLDFDGPVKKSDFLGQIDMQLDVLENEEELDGWYFLTPRPQLFQQSQVPTTQPVRSPLRPIMPGQRDD